METFRAAATSEPDDALHAMGQAFKGLLARREEFLLLLQAFAASEDHEVQQVMRRRLGEMYDRVASASGASEEQLQAFFSYGMLLMITTALDVPGLMGT